MRKTVNNFIFNASILIFCFLCSTLFADQKIDFVETTGRAVITDEASINEARRLSLEDAIFLAAIQGGARIDGYSSVDKETNLTDHFTVRPASELLDFNILSEGLDGDHYTTVIRAAVGSLNETKCSARSKVNVVKYGGEFDFSTKVPTWLREIASDIELEIGNLLHKNSKFSINEVAPIKLKINELVNTNDEFDYKSLTRGRIRVKSGDFALVPTISMTISNSRKNIETEKFLTFLLITRLFRGVDYVLAEKSEYKVLMKLKTESPWRTFDMLTRKTRDQIKFSLMSGLSEHVDDLVDKVECIPLTAKLRINDRRLVVDLGHSHGVTTNSLAVSSGFNTPYSILQVVETSANQTILEPLNKSLEISSLTGKTINFME